MNKMCSKKRIIIAVAFLVSVIFFVFADNAYPIPAGDSMFFLVPAVEFAKHGSLVNPIDPVGWPINRIIDPSGMKKFLFHPPLFQVVLRALMPEASPEGALLALSFINIAVIWLSALLFYKVAARRKELDWSMVGLIVLAFFALAASLTEVGRPETLARLWAVLGALTPFYISKRYSWICFGVILGLMFATHAAAGVFSIFVLGLMFGIVFFFREIVIKGSAMLLVAFVVSLGGIAIGPYGIRETIEGTFVYATIIVHSIGQEGLKLFTSSNFLNHYIFSQAAPFYGAAILLLFVSGIFFWWKHRSRIASPTVTLICALAIAYLVGKIVYTIGHTYYIPLFAPVICLIFIRLFLETKAVGRGATIMVLALITVGFARTALLFPFFIKQGQGLKEARAEVAKVIGSYETEDVVFGIGGGSGGGSWYFFDDYKRAYPYVLSQKPKEKTAFIFIQQRYSGMLAPPEVPGCVLEGDTFSKETPSVLGIKIGNTMPGYGYAAYNCIKKE